MTDRAVVIPARNAEATLGRTLDALADQDDPDPFTVVVVDNASSDRTATVAGEHRLAPLVVAGPGTGPGAARNAGARATDASVLAFTDADCEPEPDWLRHGTEALQAAGLVQGRVLPAAGVPVGPWDRTLAVVRDWGLFESANLFVRRPVFDALGGFTDVSPVGGVAGQRPFGEDTDFGWRARRAGVVTAFAADACVRHAVFAGRARDHLAERARDGLFCELVERVPELRDAFLYRRWFLSARSAAFDAALLGLAAGLTGRRVAGLLLALPYARALRAEARRRGASGWDGAALLLAADTVGCASLVSASARSRSLVL